MEALQLLYSLAKVSTLASGPGTSERLPLTRSDARAASELHRSTTPDEVLLGRLETRNAELPPGTFYIDGGRLRAWMQMFLPPTCDGRKPHA